MKDFQILKKLDVHPLVQNYCKIQELKYEFRYDNRIFVTSYNTNWTGVSFYIPKNIINKGSVELIILSFDFLRTYKKVLLHSHERNYTLFNTILNRTIIKTYKYNSII